MSLAEGVHQLLKIVVRLVLKKISLLLSVASMFRCSLIGWLSGSLGGTWRAVFVGCRNLLFFLSF